MQALEAIATINLWGTNFWQQRKAILIEEFFSNNLTADHTVILVFQEVVKGEVYPLVELAEALGFSKKQVYFFPTLISGQFGLGVVTNLNIEKKNFVFFTHDKTDPLEFGERGIALLSLADSQEKILLGATHLSVSEQMQYLHAFESINAVKQFILYMLAEDKKIQFLHESLAVICEKNNLRLLIAGDFNAAPVRPLYELFAQAGLTDYTLPLHKKHPYSWPVDTQWLIMLHKKMFGKNPPFDVHKLQRWIDYVWGIGFKPKSQVLLGTHATGGMYPSDHAIPVVYF